MFLGVTTQSAASLRQSWPAAVARNATLLVLLTLFLLSLLHSRTCALFAAQGCFSDPRLRNLVQLAEQLV